MKNFVWAFLTACLWHLDFLPLLPPLLKLSKKKIHKCICLYLSASRLDAPSGKFFSVSGETSDIPPTGVVNQAGVNSMLSLGVKTTASTRMSISHLKYTHLTWLWRTIMKYSAVSWQGKVKFYFPAWGAGMEKEEYIYGEGGWKEIRLGRVLVKMAE